MKRALMILLACAGCVMNTDPPTEALLLDDGAIRVRAHRLTLDDGRQVTELEGLRFMSRSPFAEGGDTLPFDYAGHEMELEATRISNMVAVGGEVGLQIDGDYVVVSLHRNDPEYTDGWSRMEVLEFDFTVEGRVVHATLEVDTSYHCPPFPTEPAEPERSGPPAVAGGPL